MKLTEFQNRLEEAADSIRMNLELVSIIKSIIGNPVEASKDLLLAAQYEIDFFNLNILKNHLKPSMVYTDKNGNPVNEPDISKFSKEQLDYLESRGQISNNGFLKSHYCHILWLSPRKSIKYAQGAINGHFQLIIKFKELEAEEPGKANWRLMINSIENCFLLTNSIKWKNEEIKSLIINLVHNYDITLKSAGGVLRNIVEFMLSEKKEFQKIDFLGVVQRLDDLRKSVEKDDLHFATDIVGLIVKVEQRLSNDLKDWYNLLGEIWEKLTRERKNGSFVTTDFCRTAISFYMMSGNEKKVDGLKKLYKQLRKEVNLGQVGRDIDVTELNKEIKKLTGSIITLGSDDIIKLLMSSNEFIPSKEKLLKTVREDQSFMFKVSSSVIDEKGNTSRHYQKEDEKDFEQLLFNYNIEIQLWFFPLMKEVIFSAVSLGKMNYLNVLSYLQNNSWYGQELEFAVRNDVELKGKWLAQIAPSVVEFFMALDQFIFSEKSNWNLITVFDSLTVKIEGLVRSLAEYSDIDTFIIKKDKSGRTISEEKDIMRLLTDSEVIQLIGEDDVLFLRYLFTERSGLNIRNKVAHGLMKYEDYALGTLIMIFIAVLRLGRFQLKKSQNELVKES
ncbi:MAG: DUF4209 domain-containing protein [Cyclobacteriaceae bacterium]